MLGVSVPSTNNSSSITSERTAIAALLLKDYESIIHIYTVTMSCIEPTPSLSTCEFLLDYVTDSIPLTLVNQVYDPAFLSLHSYEDDGGRQFHISDTSLLPTGQPSYIFTTRVVYLKDMYSYPPIFSRKSPTQITEFLSEFYGSCENPMSVEYLSADYEDLMSTEMAVHDRLRMLPCHSVAMRIAQAKRSRGSNDTSTYSSYNASQYDGSEADADDPSDDTAEDVQHSGRILREALCNAAASLPKNTSKVGSDSTTISGTDSTDNSENSPDLSSSSLLAQSSAVIFSDGSIVVSPSGFFSRDSVESLFESIQLAIRNSSNAQTLANTTTLANGKRSVDSLLTLPVHPLFLVTIDRGGILHAPLSGARKLYLENGYGSLPVLFHDADGSLQFETMKSLSAMSTSSIPSFYSYSDVFGTAPTTMTQVSGGYNNISSSLPSVNLAQIDSSYDDDGNEYDDD